jgi:glycosyltransferase involved in cell wall biosynthesis
MKIAFLSDAFLLDESATVTGTHVQIYNLARGFEIRNLDVHYVSLTKAWKRKEDIIDGLKIHWIPRGKNAFSWLEDLKAFPEALNEIRPDVIYQRGRSHLTYVAARWAEKNGGIFVWASNGEDSCDSWKNIRMIQNSGRPFWKKWLLYPYAGIQDLLIHKGVAKATHVVNQTEHQKLQLWKNYEKTGVVLPSYFFPLPEKPLQKKEKIILWLANLGPGKQPELFLQLAEHCADCPEWTFILAGSTDNRVYQEKVMSLAAPLKNVRMIGRVPFHETYNYFARAKLFANTSAYYSEGMPNTFIQAWLNKTPVLSLNHNPNDWITGYNLGIFANGDTRELLCRGRQLICDDIKLQELGENGFRFAVNTFVRESIIDSYLRLFEV